MEKSLRKISAVQHFSLSYSGGCTGNRTQKSSESFDKAPVTRRNPSKYLHGAALGLSYSGGCTGKSNQMSSESFREVSSDRREAPEKTLRGVHVWPELLWRTPYTFEIRRAIERRWQESLHRLSVVWPTFLELLYFISAASCIPSAKETILYAREARQTYLLQAISPDTMTCPELPRLVRKPT